MTMDKQQPMTVNQPMAIDKVFTDVEDMLSKVSAQIPMLSEEAFLVHEFEHQYKVYILLTLLGLVMIFFAVLRNVM